MSLCSVRLLTARLPSACRLRCRSLRRSAPPPRASFSDDMTAPKPRFTPTEFVVDKTDAFASLQLRTIADEARQRAPRSLAAAQG